MTWHIPCSNTIHAHVYMWNITKYLINISDGEWVMGRHYSCKNHPLWRIHTCTFFLVLSETLVMWTWSGGSEWQENSKRIETRGGWALQGYRSNYCVSILIIMKTGPQCATLLCTVSILGFSYSWVLPHPQLQCSNMKVNPCKSHQSGQIWANYIYFISPQISIV